MFYCLRHLFLLLHKTVSQNILSVVIRRPLLSILGPTANDKSSVPYIQQAMNKDFPEILQNLAKEQKSSHA